MTENRRFTIFCLCMAVFVFLAISIGVVSVKKTRQETRKNEKIAREYLSPEERVEKEEKDKKEVIRDIENRRREDAIKLKREIGEIGFLESL